MATLTTQVWTRTQPTKDWSEYLDEKFKYGLSLFKPLDYIGYGASAGSHVPMIAGWSGKVTEILDVFSGPLQAVSLATDVIAAERLVQGKNEELEGKPSAITRLGLSILTGICQLCAMAPVGGFVLRLHLLGSLSSTLSAVLKFREDILEHPSVKKLFFSVLAVVSAGLGLFMLFHSVIFFNILYLILTTFTLFFNGEEESTEVTA